MGTSIQLNEGALEPLEENNFRQASRSFAVGGGFVVTVTKLPEPATFTHPPEGLEPPKYSDCAEAIAFLFGKLMTSPLPGFLKESIQRVKRARLAAVFPFPADVSESLEDGGPDFEGAWREYRKALAETAGIHLRPWDRLPSEVIEAFCAAGWELLEGGKSHRSKADEGIDAEGVIRWYDNRRRQCDSCKGAGCRYCQAIPPEGLVDGVPSMTVDEWARNSAREINGAGGGQ